MEFRCACRIYNERNTNIQCTSFITGIVKGATCFGCVRQPYLQPDNGFFMKPKHIAAFTIATIKRVHLRVVFLSLCINLQTQIMKKKIQPTAMGFNRFLKKHSLRKYEQQPRLCKWYMHFILSRIDGSCSFPIVLFPPCCFMVTILIPLQPCS